MREEERRMALYSMADAHAAVRPRATRLDSERPRLPDRTVSSCNHPIGRDRPLGWAPGISNRSDGRTRSSSDPADASAAAWNGIEQAVRPIGRPPGDFHHPPDRIAVASGGRLECRQIPRMRPTDRTVPPLIVRCLCSHVVRVKI